MIDSETSFPPIEVTDGTLATWVEELSELLRIPSVSAAPEHAADVLLAGAWVRDFLRRCGATVDLVEHESGSLVVGTVPASSGATDVPRITLYGHYDVQPAVPLAAWDSDPFEPEVRDGWLYARGATDNKGNLFCMLKAVELLRMADALPVEVDILIEGEEEIGGSAIIDHLRADERPVHAFLSFDSSWLKADQPMLYIGMRGLVYLRLSVRAGASELHSGTYGGAAANALNLVVGALAGLMPLSADLSAGAIPLTPQERAAIETLDPARTMLAEIGARPIDARSEEEFWTRTLAEPALDVHGIAGGSPEQQKAIVAPRAEATFSIRVAPGQDALAVAGTVRTKLLGHMPAAVDADVEVIEASSGYVQDPGLPALRMAATAIERATGRAPLALRGGASIPVLELVAERGVPIVLTGFGSPDSYIHAANERLRLDMLAAGVSAAAEILQEFAALTPRPTPEKVNG